MKILVISNLYPPKAVGGYERLCRDVTDALVLKGHQVSVLTSSYGGGVADDSGRSVERSLTLFATEGNIYKPFGCSPDELDRLSESNVQRLKRKIAEESPDVLFVWNLYFFNHSLLDATEASRRDVVFLLTDNWLISFLNTHFLGRYFTELVYGKPSFENLLRRFLHRLRYRLDRRTTFPMKGRAVFASRFMKSLYAEAGIRFDHSIIVHHGVHLDHHGDDEYVQRGVFLHQEEVRLLFAGRIVEVKGVHTAIEALPSIIRAVPDYRVRLTILGEGQDRPYVQWLHDLVDRWSLSDHVEFLPAVREADLFDLFQKYDIYLFPSLYEPFSLTLIHALAAGIPTVASDAGGNGEIVSHLETGLLFSKGDPRQLADAVIRLTKNPEMCESISIDARRVAHEYTFERMVGQIEDYLKARS